MSYLFVQSTVPSKRGRGRPSVMKVFLAELHRRAAAGMLEPTQAREMRALRTWYMDRYPTDRRTPLLKTLRRKLGSEYNTMRKRALN
jgi:hypothetical protein